MKRPTRVNRNHGFKRRIPAVCTLIGELGDCVIADPRDRDSFYVLDYLPGRLLVATGDREMFIVNPLGPDQTMHRETAMHLDDAFDLYEKFTGLRADRYYSCRFPTPRAAKPAGELVIVRYRAAKVEGDDVSTSWYEHYFDGGESGFPAPARIDSLGNGQYWIPPGNWRVTERGIEYYDAASDSYAEGAASFNSYFGKEGEPW